MWLQCVKMGYRVRYIGRGGGGVVGAIRGRGREKDVGQGEKGKMTSLIHCFTPFHASNLCGAFFPLSELS